MPEKDKKLLDEIRKMAEDIEYGEIDVKILISSKRIAKAELTKSMKRVLIMEKL